VRFLKKKSSNAFENILISHFELESSLKDVQDGKLIAITVDDVTTNCNLKIVTLQQCNFEFNPY
jgi:hypothetical protein